MLKPLRSCTRCRKNKIKCDSADTRPGACTACAKRGLVCTLDYVVPPRRSDELKKLHQSVSCVKSNVDRLLQNAVASSVVLGDQKTDEHDFELLDNTEHVNDGSCCHRSSSNSTWSYSHYQQGHLQQQVTWSSIKKSLIGTIPSRIFKISDEFFIRLMLENRSLLFNNFELDLLSLEEVLFDFTFILKSLLPKERLPAFNNIGQMLLSKEGSLYLVSIINFYFDIPGFDYLEFYDHVCSNQSKYQVSQLWLFSNVVLYGPAYFSSKVSLFSLPSSCLPLQTQCFGSPMATNLRPAFAKLYFSSEFRFHCPKLYSIQERFNYFKHDPLLQLIQFKCKPQRIVPGSSTSLSLSELSICQFNDQR
ncbi:unnamed protein product [Kluyveromyces dobzhanskii CBS 2104]|uniref:WGS project CCBQ000000000 data, contig 00098 n=1 Tax=Kluyveromyces dobzhanskii CBS 2104 TaxID=1427455 RepID=A0A0A8L584_9SACH|nr:unnamed protein product [Kluyveromyces dobzhanskii CBS 2104]